MITGLEKYIQVISEDLMNILKESAKEHGISLDMEIAMRLMACMAEPELTQDNALSSQVLRRTFTRADAIAECKRNREGALFSYEMEKLRLYLRFEKSLPRHHIKETFQLIDVESASKKIRAELAAEEKQNEQDQGE